jgi:pimeloyl-ACP methyl ester carboxylesterase
MERGVRTPDGRTLAVEDAGDPAGRPVLVHLGTPNSLHLYGPNVADAAGRGLRLISYDRPGYGGSTPQPGRSIADCAGDVRAICAALEIEHVDPWGFDLAGITVPVLLLHGRKDKFVPFGHGQWLATQIPRVEARLFDKDGHLTIAEHHIGDVHAWLSERL